MGVLTFWLLSLFLNGTSKEVLIDLFSLNANQEKVMKNFYATK